MTHAFLARARSPRFTTGRVFSLLFALFFAPLLRSAHAEAGPNLLINPGAESGNLTGWTLGGTASAHADAGTFNPGLNPQSGTWDFVGGSGASASLAQVVPLTGLAPVWQQIDAGNVIASVSFFQQSIVQIPADTAAVSVQFYDASLALISLFTTSDFSDNSWTNHTLNVLIPSGARYIDYLMLFNRHSGNDLDAYIDSNSLTLGFNGTSWSSAANNHLWNTAANWVSGVPTSALPARLTRASGTETVTFDGNYNAPLSALYIDAPAGITLNQSINTMRATAEFVGNAYTGNYTQSGGANITPTLYLGYYQNAHGSYTLSGGTLSADTQYVGFTADAAFLQTGGSNTPINLYVGYTAGAPTASYALSAGSLSVTTSEYVGYGGTGLFSQTGGTHTVTSILYVGYLTGSTGTYNLAGGTLTAAGVSLGGLATPGVNSSLTISGSGQLFSSITVYFGSNSLTLADGGTITGFINSPNSQFNFTGGTLNWTDTADFIIDPGKIFTPIAGFTTFTGSQVLNLPHTNLLIGDGNFARLTLAGPETITIGTPTDNKSLQISPKFGISQNILTLSNPSANLIVNGTIYVGGSATVANSIGLLAINNGHVSTNTLRIWNFSNVLLSAGTLDVGSLELFSSTITINGGTATILNPVTFQNAGTVTLNGGMLRIAALETPPNPNPNFAWSGGTLALLEGIVIGQSSLTVPLTGTLAGSGIVFSPIALNGSISVTNPFDNLSIHGTVIGPGNISISPSASLTSDAIRVNTLNISGLVRIRAAGGTSKLNSLTLAGATNTWAGKLDLNDNGLIIAYDTAPNGAALLARTYNQIITARGHPDSNGISDYSGNGITSSTASTNNHLAGFNKFYIGVINNADLAAIGLNPAYSTFKGLAGIAANSILARYTYAGDINLDGKIDIDDYNYIDSGFGGLLTAFSGLIIGDFNNDGKINIDDYNVIDTGFGFQGAPLADSDLSPLTFLAVPEPASTLFLLAALPLLVKRKRRALH